MSTFGRHGAALPCPPSDLQPTVAAGDQTGFGGLRSKVHEDVDWSAAA
jgi:hypothetical protein